MRFALKVLAGLFLAMSLAQAACPPDRPYNCVPGWGGKMRCGCGV